MLFLSLVLLILLVTGFKLYLKLSTGWCRSQTCLVGKTAIVTGANTGIGYETALDFAKRGARVILACRNAKRAEEARNNIINETGNDKVVVRLIDTSSFESVRKFAKEINESEDRLDILVNNAGAGGVGDKKSEDGQVFLMQINYFSTFLLTHLLLGLMKKTKHARIVNVSSIAATFTKNFDIKNIDKFPGIYQDYCHSKLCQILFTIELGQRLQGTGVTTYSLHPGCIRTELYRNATGGIGLVFDVLKRLFFKTSLEGAQTTIYCGVAKGIEKYNGEHFENCRKVKRYNVASAPDLAKKLWERTTDIVQLKPEKTI